ncbi:hypothetical protein Tco_0312411 [Tanacetum coccineum]
MLVIKIFSERKKDFRERKKIGKIRDDPSRQYQPNFDISFYIIPHGHSLTELTQEKHIPEVITQIEQDTPHNEVVEGLKVFLMMFEVTAALIDVNAAQSKLVLLENFNENYSKCLRLLVKLQLLVQSYYCSRIRSIILGSTSVSGSVCLRETLLEDLDQDSAHMMIDYALWEVIENGATLPKIAVVEGVEKVMPITSAEDKAQRRLEVKARSTLIMGIPNEHQLKFKSIKDVKLLPKALELSDEKLSQEDVNQKLLRSLSPEWNTHAVVWRNKAELETISMDDLYNNLKVYEPEVKGMSSSSSNIQNMAFVSSLNNNTNSTNEAVNTAHEVSTASTQVNAAYSKILIT